MYDVWGVSENKLFCQTDPDGYNTMTVINKSIMTHK